MNLQGHKEGLGFWAAANEGAKFWLGVMTELKNRGVEDFLIAWVDGLKGFPEAMAQVLPKTPVQLCSVQLVRTSRSSVAWKNKQEVAADWKTIDGAATAQAGQDALDMFMKKWRRRDPMIVKSWLNNWPRIIPFFVYPTEIRRVSYTTKASSSRNFSWRKVIKNRSLFPTDEAVFKLLYLALRNVARKWTMPIKDWPRALQMFAIIFEGRRPLM